MKMERIECSETSAYKIQTPGNHPEENIQHTGDVGKGKVLPIYTMKIYRGSKGIVSVNTNIDTRQRYRQYIEREHTNINLTIN
jgi:hypothetical protein